MHAVIDAVSSWSEGDQHDYYSEGDYWWPDPDNFLSHRKAMRRFSKMVPALAAAYKITGKKRYVEEATKHLKAGLSVTIPK